MTNALIIAALDHLKAGGWKTGADWDWAHEICQKHEGQADFDWVHALCHRIEGDNWNAGYWYRRAGRPVADGSFADEAAVIRITV